jgi:hypothetical protein
MTPPTVDVELFKFGSLAMVVEHTNGQISDVIVITPPDLMKSDTKDMKRKKR